MLYQRIQKSRDSANWGTVTKKGIRKTERAWLIYRDAFAEFAKVKFPSFAPEGLEKAPTEERIKSLEELND